MFITVGRVLKPQGINGEVKIQPLTDDPTRFKKLKVLYIDGAPFDIRSLRLSEGFVYVKLNGIDDRNAAETLRGKNADIDRVNAKPLEDGEYFIADLIGSAVVTQDGARLGKVVDVTAYGAASVCTVKGEHTFSFPFVKKVIVSFDEESKILTLDGEALKEVAVEN